MQISPPLPLPTPTPHPLPLTLAILNRLKPSLALAPQVENLTVQHLDHVTGSVNRGPELATLPLPPADPINLCVSTSLFRVDLVAELAFLADRDRLHDEFHAACFTCAVFSVAMLSKVSPFPIAACKSMLVEEAHVGWFDRFLLSND